MAIHDYTARSCKILEPTDEVSRFNGYEPGTPFVHTHDAGTVEAQFGPGLLTAVCGTVWKMGCKHKNSYATAKQKAHDLLMTDYNNYKIK